MNSVFITGDTSRGCEWPGMPLGNCGAGVLGSGMVGYAGTAGKHHDESEGKTE